MSKTTSTVANTLVTPMPSQRRSTSAFTALSDLSIRGTHAGRVGRPFDVIVASAAIAFLEL